jgi:hypothetical protein
VGIAANPMAAATVVFEKLLRFIFFLFKKQIYKQKAAFAEKCRRE